MSNPTSFKIGGKHQILTLIFILCFAQLFAQDIDYILELKTSALVPDICTELSAEKRQSAQHNLLLGKYPAILQFYSIPNTTQRAALRLAGIELQDYVPNYAYTSLIPTSITSDELLTLNVRAILPIHAKNKIQKTIFDGKNDENTAVIIHVMKNISTQKIIDELAKQHISTHYSNKNNTLEATLNRQQIETLAGLAFVRFIEPIGELPQPLGTRSKSVKGNYLNSPLGGGLLGEGVIVGVGEGGAAAHIDFVGRIINDVEEDYLQDDHHANLVGGMLGGAGILRERVKGIAPKAICLFDTGSQLMTDSNIDTKVAEGMVLTNHSYGAGEGGEYSFFSARTDNQQKRHPQLLHIFSVGNSGKKEMAGYPDGFNTVLTHGQSSKNSISVGGINHLNELYVASSRGPTMDGRLKPEISAIAYGFVAPGASNNYAGGFGTSFSAPQVAGGLALLYEHYRNLHGEDPEGALMKAILCNTAEDLGNPGPDFTYGFGKLNLRRAKALLDAGNFFENEVEHEETKVQTIIVPPGLSELKVMLYWSDTTAAMVSGKQLVNDLDLRLISPNNNVYLPYVLDTQPDRVERDAFPFVDRTNNVEQVVIKNPMPGTYTVNIRGHTIPYEAQKFHVTCEHVKAELVVTAPVPGEVLPGGGSTNYYVEWDYNGPDDHDENGEDERFTIDYTENNGATWVVLNDSVASNARIYKWEKHRLKGINSSDVWIRVTKNGTPYFRVVAAACKLYDFIGRKEYDVTPLCNDEILFEWNKIDDAYFYEILTYNGGNEMEVATSTTDTSLVYTYDYDNGECWFSLRAVYADGQRSLISDAKLFMPPMPTAVSSCPPSPPDNISYQTGQYHIQFFWEAATDDLGVTGYVIYKDSIPVQTVNSLDYMVHDIQPGVNVQYCISAIDIHGNESYLNCFSTSTFSQDFCNQDVLFVTQDKILTDAEIVIYDHLQSVDYHAFSIGKNNLQDYLWDKNWTIVISPEAEIAVEDMPLFDDVSLLLLNFDIMDDFHLSSGNISGIGSRMNVKSPYHPGAAGQRDEVDIYIGDYYFRGAAQISTDAIPIITHENTANILFAYEAGHTMLNNVMAQKRRVAYPIEYYHVESLSNEAWMLFDASLAWAADCAPKAPATPSNLNLTPDFTAINVEWEIPPVFGDIVKYVIYINDSIAGLTSDNNYTINYLSPSTEYKVSVSALNIQDTESTRIYDNTTTLTCKNLELYAWLEGALYLQENDSMRTDLSNRNLLPRQAGNNDNDMLSDIGHPYFETPWNYWEAEQMDIYAADIVDWLLVSFRTNKAKSTEIFRMGGLLHSDGRIEFPRSCVNYEFTDSVYIVIEHRNHIGIMSPTPVFIENNQLTYDFRNRDSYASVAASGQKEIEPGVWAMYAGDCDQKNDFGSYQVTGADKIPWQIQNGVFNTYDNEDMNLDGDTNGKDKHLWFKNNGIYSSVPR